MVDIHVHIANAHIHHDCADVLGRVDDRLSEIVQLLITLEEVQMAGIDRVLSEVTETRGSVDSVLALVAGLAQYIRDNVGNEDALNAAADQLDELQQNIADAVAANPVPGGPETPVPDNGANTETDINPQPLPEPEDRTAS